MAITTPRAKKLTTASEFDLFEKSLGRNVGALTEAQLKRAVDRSRKLRDKYRQLAQRQEREARGKAKPQGRRPAQGSTQTRTKVDLFQQTLDRYEGRLAEVAGSGAKTANPATRPPGRKTKVKTKKKTTAKKATSKKATRKKTTTKKKEVQQELGAWTKGARRKKTKGKAGRVGGKTSPKVQGKVKRNTMRQTGAVKTQKHVAARGRRSQARRDSRSGRK